MIKPLALIIEDDPDLCRIFAEAVASADYETELIYDGRSALQRLEQTIPDLVVLDMHLPLVSGEQVLQHIRTTPRLAKIRVVIATADSGATIGRPGEQADIIFIKPIRFKQLQHLAERLRPAKTGPLTE